MPVYTDIQTPDEAIARMLQRLAPVDTETHGWDEAAGRVLAEPIVTDRPSPAAHVSAMDGYAVRLDDATGGTSLPIADRILPGRPAPVMAGEGVLGCVQIMTGAVVPDGADAVIKREDVTEHNDRIELPADIAVEPGQNIRRRGENEAAGVTVVDAGTPIDAAVTAALVSFGASDVRVFRRVRLAVITTGDELLAPGSPAEDYQIRDSNGPTLHAMFAPVPWIEIVSRTHVRDEPGALADAITDALGRCDALLLTGGVSAGTHDFVPGELAKAGCEIVFHKLPIRPGRPLLGAVGPSGQLVMGLPGNPVSVMCTTRRIGVPLLRRRAGFAIADTPALPIHLTEHDGRPLHLWWYRPVKIEPDGRATLGPSKGSGDLVSSARCDGFIEIPPQRDDTGPFAYTPWSIG